MAGNAEWLMDMRERFEQIYARNEWGGSGEGSRPKHTKGYADLLRRFLKDQRIKSVVDFGCGDWQFSRFIDWSGVDYHGYDIARPVVERNREQFSAPNVSFHAFDGDCASLPAADLLIVKDVLQHWSNESILAFLPLLGRYRFAILTNCVNPSGPTANVNDVDGGSRPIDLRRPPFNLAAELIYQFENYRPLWLRPFVKARWLKHVLLVRSKSA
jgi:SAM-dependent methyltransferase